MDFNVQMCDEQLKLNKYQKGLEEKMRRAFCGLSLNETLKTLLLMGDVKLADKLRAEYKVPDRRSDYKAKTRKKNQKHFTQKKKKLK